jgi:hypothetical protein
MTFIMRFRKIIIPGAVFAYLYLADVSTATAAGHDFINEARVIYRVVACGKGDGTLPDGFDAAVIREHCRMINRYSEKYRKNFIDQAGPFLAGILPKSLPARVVVPFGGGDLLPAMVVFPHATDFTTISLEGAGDPRRFARAGAARLGRALESYRSIVGAMLVSYDNSNENIRNMERGLVPNQLSFALTALAVLGYEPVSLYYFSIGPDGSIHYLTLGEIDSMENVRGQRLKKSWVDTDFSIAFRNMELSFRKKGAGPASRVIILRHIAYNLDNMNFEKSVLLKHLLNKGMVSVMMKGASYLIWTDKFKSLRDYLLSHMACMISDSTGILPRHASEAGFEQITYGKFSGAFLENSGGADAASLRALWQSQPYRPMPFRFGSSDIHGANHMIITRRGHASEK